MTERLLDVENETMMKVAELEKSLLQKDKDLVAIRVGCQQYPQYKPFDTLFKPKHFSIMVRLQQQIRIV